METTDELLQQLRRLRHRQTLMRKLAHLCQRDAERTLRAAARKPDNQSVHATVQSPLSWRTSPDTAGSRAILLTMASPPPNRVTSRILGLLERTVSTHHRIPCFGV